MAQQNPSCVSVRCMTEQRCLPFPTLEGYQSLSFAYTYQEFIRREIKNGETPQSSLT